MAKASNNDQRPFLKIDALKGRSSAKLEINGTPRKLFGKFGEQIVVPVRLGGKDYDWAFKVGGRVHQSLRAAKYQGEFTVKASKFTAKDGRKVEYLALDEPFEQDEIPF
jgi:hypothetical protein